MPGWVQRGCRVIYSQLLLFGFISGHMTSIYQKRYDRWSNQWDFRPRITGLLVIADKINPTIWIWSLFWGQNVNGLFPVATTMCSTHSDGSDVISWANFACATFRSCWLAWIYEPLELHPLPSHRGWKSNVLCSLGIVYGQVLFGMHKKRYKESEGEEGTDRQSKK